MPIVEFICSYCGGVGRRPRNKYNYSVRLYGSGNLYCSQSCSSKAHQPKAATGRKVKAAPHVVESTVKIPLADRLPRGRA